MPKPFLKWAGGKSQLLSTFAPLYPTDFCAYHEPFVGSAAVYFHLYSLQQSGHFKQTMQFVRLTDSNTELVNCYQVVRDDLDALLPLLEKHRRKHSKEYYYRMRKLEVSGLSPAQRAARLIYLNKTCFNGLYRVNRKGEFNVPMGSYTNPRIFDRDVLERASKALQSVEIEAADFREVVEHAQSRDFIYFDPPYVPLTRTASFTSYTQDEFGQKAQEELAEVFRELDRKGCYVMLSNSWTDTVLKLYKEFEPIRVEAGRAINSKGDRRGKVNELLLLNYKPGD